MTHEKLPAFGGKQDHFVGDEFCPGCIDRDAHIDGPDECVCGGLIHVEQDYDLQIKHCDRCGPNYKPASWDVDVMQRRAQLFPPKTNNKEGKVK